MSNDQPAIGPRIRIMRSRCHLSLRQLSEKAGVTAAMISLIERNKTSPSIAVLQKILSALGSDLTTFSYGDEAHQAPPVFLRERMRSISDENRSYTIVFPRHEDVAMEVMDECLQVSKKKPPFETLNCDVAGYVLSGKLALEIKGEPNKILRPGDAFYIIKGQKHRGYAVEESVRLITVISPPRY